MTERKYKDDEVRRIFELAATQKGTDYASPAAAEGLTLAEMQSVALEAGIEPDAVARAAVTLDAPAAKPPRTSLGIPIEVRHTVPLPRWRRERAGQMTYIAGRIKAIMGSDPT